LSVENQFPYFPLLYRQIIYDADKIEDWAVESTYIVLNETAEEGEGGAWTK
jgi:hypothetical protein